MVNRLQPEHSSPSSMHFGKTIMLLLYSEAESSWEGCLFFFFFFRILRICNFLDLTETAEVNVSDSAFIIYPADIPYKTSFNPCWNYKQSHSLSTRQKIFIFFPFQRTGDVHLFAVYIIYILPTSQVKRDSLILHRKDKKIQYFIPFDWEIIWRQFFHR